MFDKLKNLFKKPEPPKIEAKPKPQKKLSAKEEATQNGEPYVAILRVDLDPNNINNGAFELDWNDIFVAKLIRAGYEGKDDAQIVDRWFQTICRNVIMENYEQWEVNQPKEDRLTLQRRDLGNGYTEVG